MKQKRAQRDKQSNESLENFFEKDDTFLSFARERENACLSKRQRTIHCSSMSHFFCLCSSRNCTGNHMAHKSCGRFFISTTHTRHMLSRGRPFVFQGALGKKSFDAIQEEGVKKKKKKRENRRISLKLPPPPSGEIKPMCIREEGTLSDIKAPGRFLSEVLCIIERGISRKKVRLPVQPAPSSTPSH